MKQLILKVIVFVLLGISNASAQLSPGDLAQSHAHLEGISSCTQCHELGQKVANSKCLDCHKEIQGRLDERAGFHNSSEVKGKGCATCHSDHHGRKFEMVRFDEDNFKHDLTGYKLTGAHTKIDCRECHKPDFIDDRELKKRNESYLGLETACINCHEDYHQKTLENDCGKCHNTEAFSPAPAFDHGKTDFALAGKHQTVECIECHQKETRNGKEFQKFADIPFANCNACHDDAHKNNLGTDCKQCHTDQSFTSHSSLKHFNHNKTDFHLKGQHRQVDCFTCHQADAPPARVFQDNLGIPSNNCVACHADVHDGKLGTNCAECHTEESFKVAGSMDNFNHDLTGFALEGKHEVVDCRKCHVSESLTDPLPYSTCASCHEDYHGGEFAEGTTSPDCVECHTVKGFSPSLFTFDDHAKSDFPLDGAHLATPCFACHFSEETSLGKEGKWHFKNIGQRCVDCHEDVHVNEIATDFYPKQSCETCHSTDSWNGENSFDHGLTAFLLEGGHLRTTCADCHIQVEEKPARHFKGISQECASCHDNVHGTQFEMAGVTDCHRCHDFEDWEASNFDHSKSAFPLEGKHTEVACEKCHRETVVEGEILVEYKMVNFECVDCHQ